MSNRRGGRRTLPYVFTGQGVAMLSTVLKSERAIAVNIAIMRAFVRLRRLLAAHKDLAEKLDRLLRRMRTSRFPYGYTARTFSPSCNARSVGSATASPSASPSAICTRLMLLVPV